ncbi:MAG: transcriptional repressor LexA [Alphaproteobacteria bacterium]|nr:transcriptional repressor LexA [Alphaproteobacteria bacterium]
MLTRKQRELLVFINRRIESDGVSPSFDEMKEALNLKSKSGIHRLITALEERQFIRRLPHRARALEILRLPEDLNPAPARGAQPMAKGFAPNVIAGNFPVRSPEPEPPEEAAVPQTPAAAGASGIELPLFGRIAAGTPIEALRDPNVTISVPPSMLGGGDHYALEIDGDSMIEAGIFDGDTVIIKQCDTAENGAIVVALVDGQEATLKRLRRKGDSIALEPANVTHKIQIYGPDRVKVQGRLVGLLRSY